MSASMRFAIILASMTAALGLGGCDNSNNGTDGGPTGNDGGPTGTDGGPTGHDAGPVDDDAGPTTAALRDVTLDISDADPHIGNRVELRVVDATDTLVARGVLEALPSGTYSFALPNSTPEGAHRLDFFADLSGNGTYDAPPADHAWRNTVTASATGATVNFDHNTDFTDVGF